MTAPETDPIAVEHRGPVAVLPWIAPTLDLMWSSRRIDAADAPP